MEKFLVSIRLLFFLAVAIITFLATRPHGYGYIGRKIRAAKQRFHNFHERMKTPQFPRAHEDFYQCTEILHVYH